MPDELKGQEQEVKEQVPSPMSSENQPAEPQVTEGELPEGVSERTKSEFEKLKEHNRKLAEELEAVKSQKTVEEPPKSPLPSVLDSLRPDPSYGFQQVAPMDTNQQQYAALNPKQVENIVERLTDENGYVDEALLKRTLDEANKRALYAEQRATQAEQLARQANEQVARFGQSYEVRRTHEAFPEIDPTSPKFDANLYEEVRKEVVYGMATKGSEDFFGAAAKIVGKVRQNSEQAQQVKQAQDQVKSQTAQAQKEIINQAGASKPDADEYQSLVDASRQGKEGSIAARLKAAGHTF